MHSRDDRTWAPRVIAHRGDSAHAPENTAPAFDRALEVGADGIELDLQLSRDGVVVIYHDHKLAKLGLRSRHIRDYDWAQLALRDAGVWRGPEFAETRILTLAQVLEGWAPRTRLLLEIKAYGRNRQGSRDLLLARKAAQMLAELPATALDNIRVLSFSAAVLDTVAETLHEAGLLPPRLVRNLATPAELERTRAAQLATYAACCVNIDAFVPEQVRRVHRAGLRLYAYTVDSEAQIRCAHALGCSVLICNDPALVRERVAAMALPPPPVLTD